MPAAALLARLVRPFGHLASEAPPADSSNSIWLRVDRDGASYTIADSHGPGHDATCDPADFRLRDRMNSVPIVVQRSLSLHIHENSPRCRHHPSLGAISSERAATPSI